MLDALAMAQNLTQPPHLRPGISVLGHEDGSTPLLTVAGVIMHVLTTSQVVGRHLPATNTPNFNFQGTLGALAVAQNLIKPHHLRKGISVLGHEDGSTPHLTVAGVIVHVLTTSQLVGMAPTGPKHTQLQLPSDA